MHAVSPKCPPPNCLKWKGRPVLESRPVLVLGLGPALFVLAREQRLSSFRPGSLYPSHRMIRVMYLLFWIFALSWTFPALAEDAPRSLNVYEERTSVALTTSMTQARTTAELNCYKSRDDWHAKEDVVASLLVRFCSDLRVELRVMSPNESAQIQYQAANPVHVFSLMDPQLQEKK